MSCWDVVVVGAGPAGALAARQLALAGRSVLLVERERIPRWKVCGGCLGPAARHILETVGLGALPVELGGRPLRRMILGSGTRSATVPLERSIGISRAAFDYALVDAARNAGVTVRAATTARLGPTFGGGRGVGLRGTAGDPMPDASYQMTASIIIDASGLRGSLSAHDPEMSAPNTARRIAPQSRIGLGAVFPPDAVTIEDGELRMVVSDAGYVGVVRVEDSRVNVAAAVDPPSLRNSDPQTVIGRILDGSGIRVSESPILGWKGTPPLTRSPAEPPPERVFRLGDAAGYVEPFTGEGMGWALADAVRVVPLILRGLDGWDPELPREWDARRRRQARASTRLCRALAWGLRRPALVRTGVHLLQRAPALAVPLVRHSARAPEFT